MSVGLDRARLGLELASVELVRRVEVVDRATSTQDVAERLAREGAESGTVVVADTQTHGRGRSGRRWHSPPGLGLYLSVVVRPRGGAREPTHWTLASALAACETCRRLGASSVTIKWPNDVVHDGRKLAGTLVTLRTRHERGVELIVGTGFNVNHAADDFPPELPAATSLRLARGGAPVDRENLAAVYLGRLAGRLAQVDSGSGAAVLEEWRRHAPGAEGARVRVNPGGGAEAYQGVTRGVEPCGALRVERSDGTVVPVRLAESLTLLEP